MVVEELVTILGFKTKGVGDLAKAKKAYEDLIRSLRKYSKTTAQVAGKGTGLFSYNGAELKRNERAIASIARQMDKLGASTRSVTLAVTGLSRSYDKVARSAEKARIAMIAVTRADRRAASRRRDDFSGSTAIIAPHIARRQRSSGSGIGTGGLAARAALGAGNIGVGYLGAAGAAYGVGSVLNKAYQSAVSFERSMIEVGKATDASGAELTGYEQKILDLARATGKTKEDLASMLSQAGFAGRPGKELMDFTEYAAKATVAWGTSAEDTGQALAEIGNIYEADQKRIEQIGDAINAMADSSASKESDLLEFMRRAGASAKQAGITAEPILAFGAALKEVGVRNEVAATGFEALLNVMKLGEEFSKSAGEGLEGLGINSTKMRKAFVAKPIETMVGLLEKLNKVSDPLKKAEIMTNLFGKEYQDDIAKLLNALPKLKQYLGLMGDAQKIASRGVRFQFGQNLDKDVVRIDRATQAIDVLFKRVGTPIKIAAGGIADQINDWIKRLEESDTVAQRVIKRIQEAAGLGKEKSSEGGTKSDPIGSLATQLLRLVDPELDASETKKEITEGQKRVKDLEAEIAKKRADMIGKGASPEQADLNLRNKRMALKRAQEALEKATKADKENAEAAQARKKTPPSMLQDPTAPIQGQPGTVGPGVTSFNEAYPMDLYGYKKKPITNPPLPPRRPEDMITQGGIDRIEDVLGPAKPKVDTSEIEAAKGKASEAGAEMKQSLNDTFHPQVDTSSIQAAIGLAQTFASTMRSVATGSVSAVRTAAATPAGRAVGSLNRSPSAPAAGSGTMTAQLRRDMTPSVAAARALRDTRTARRGGGSNTNVGGVTVQVAQTNASPAEIGKATGDGVRRGIRSASVVTGGPVAA